MPDKTSLPALLRSKLGLNDTETVIVLRLLTWGCLAREGVCALATKGHRSIELSSVNGLIGALRQKLAAHGITITTVRDFGFELPRKARERVFKLLRQVRRRQWRHADAPGEARRRENALHGRLKISPGGTVEWRRTVDRPNNHDYHDRRAGRE